MRLLILGGTGQVGQEIRRRAVPRGVEVSAPTRHELDLRDRAKIQCIVETGRWDAIVNAAAYTDVDRAESEQDLVFDINAHALGHVATSSAKLGIPLIHISTDYVFDGSKRAPYVESDAPAPLNIYGQSKLLGEQRIRLSNSRHIIFRTSWVYSTHGRNFVKTILRLASERDVLNVIADQRGCPTAAVELAEVCLDAAVVCAESPQTGRYGTYHFAGSGAVSWYEFATAIVDLAASYTGRRPEVQPINTCDYASIAVRPQDTRLDCSAATVAFGRVPAFWRESLSETIKCLFKNGRN